MYKILGGDGKEYGPVAAETLRDWLRQGRANGSTQVRAEGATTWVELRSLPEFAADLAPERPPLPPAAPAAGPRPTFSETASNAPRSGMAVTSVVLGALGFLTLGVTALIGLVLGIIAMARITGSQGRIGGKGMAVAGIVTSGVALVSVPFIAIMAGLLLPALAQAKNRAQEINCINNLRQIQVGIRIYASDNDEKFPAATNWCDAIVGEVGSPTIFQCLASPGTRSGYAFNRKLSGLAEDDVDPQTVMLFESDLGWNGAGGPEAVAQRHRRGVTVGFVDGSVQSVPRERVTSLRWDP